jgi:hypothetical protein
MGRTEELFDLFVHKSDFLAPELITPFTYNGYTYASNTYVAIRTVGEMVTLGTPLNVSKAIQAEAHFNNARFPVEHCTVSINAPEFIDTYISHRATTAKQIQESKSCPKCDGCGKIECDECGHEYDCPECDGDGTIEKAIYSTTETVPDPDADYIVFESIFKGSQLEIFAEALKLIAADDFIWHINKKNLQENIIPTVVLFEVGIFEILMMPASRYNIEKEYIELGAKYNA